MVTRRVVESRTYDIYEVSGAEFKPLGEKTIIGRVKGNDIAKEYKVKKVVLVEKAVNKKIYGVPVEDFMKIAVEVEVESESDDTEDTADTEVTE
jgi:hypothetical protein